MAGRETDPKGVAVVTGAGSGIGRAVALALLKDGYGVALAGRRAEALAETAELSGEAKERALAIPADISDPAAVEQLFAETVGRFGRVDLLFNNAGTFGGSITIEDLSVKQWTDVVNVNLNGAFYCAQAAFRQMKAQSPQGGRIINNGSISAHTPRPNATAYTATKHAITGLTKSIALDGRRFDIACGQIDIGNVASAMTGTFTSAGVLQASGEIGTEPTMDAGHVADAVLYMASLPLTANVLFMTVMATKMPFVGRG